MRRETTIEGCRFHYDGGAEEELDVEVGIEYGEEDRLIIKAEDGVLYIPYSKLEDFVSKAWEDYVSHAVGIDAAHEDPQD